MRSPLVVAATVALGTAAFCAYAWQTAARDRDEPTKAQALALSRALAADAAEATETVARAEQEIAARLELAARWADEIVSASGLRISHDGEALERAARATHVAWIALVSADGSARVVRWPPPVTVEGELVVAKNAAEMREAADAVRTLAPEKGAFKVEGLTHANAFGVARERFGVAFGREDGSVLLLRAGAAEVVDLRRRFGLESSVARVASVEGVRRARILDADGRRVAGDDPRAAPRPAASESIDRSGDEVRAVAPVRTSADASTLFAEVALSTSAADAALASERTRIAVAGGAVVAIALAAGLGLSALERRHARARAALEARRDEDRRLAETGAIASLLTHEISNPLNSIRLGLHLLSGNGAQAGPSSRDEIARTLRAEADRMAATMEAVLALARSRRTGVSRVDARVLGDSTARVAAAAQSKRVRVVVEVDRNAPQEVQGDAVVLEQAIASVVRNAVEASPEGGRVDVRWVPGEHEGVRIVVDDQGPGFPPGDRDSLVRLGRTEKAGGHGVGLALAKRFVEADGGRLVLGDAPGGGARVEIALPAAAPPVSP